jgi:MFS superfamily sulfate permease-like transporter
MHVTFKEIWSALHGMLFGAGFLLVFSGGVGALRGLRGDWLTEDGAKHRLSQLALGSWCMTALAWVAVLVGTYVVYPWYRAKPPGHASAVTLADYPKYLLISKPQTADWHEFGMEWKEHIAWLVPILATAVAFVVSRHGPKLLRQDKLRQALLILFTISFFCAAVAGIFGALINKAAPTR